MRFDFGYKQMRRPAGLPPISAPMIPVTLSGSGGSLHTTALVDSGADTSAITADVAEVLGLDVSGEPSKAQGIGGEVKVVGSKMAVAIKGRREQDSFVLPVQVIMEKTLAGFPILLGRRGFFDRYEITFMPREKKMVLKRRLESDK